MKSDIVAKTKQMATLKSELSELKKQMKRLKPIQNSEYGDYCCKTGIHSSELETLKNALDASPELKHTHWAKVLMAMNKIDSHTIDLDVYQCDMRLNDDAVKLVDDWCADVKLTKPAQLYITNVVLLTESYGDEDQLRDLIRYFAKPVHGWDQLMDAIVPWAYAQYSVTPK